jgi:hypothetical protein
VEGEKATEQGLGHKQLFLDGFYNRAIIFSSAQNRYSAGLVTGKIPGTSRAIPLS